MNFFKGFFIIVLGIIVIGGFYVGSGRYNVSAVAPHWKLTEWLLEEAREQSVEYHSRGIQGPTLLDPQKIAAGFEHFHETCRLCHGSPDSISEFASGMNPSPPDLKSADVQKESDGALYWIVKNGIKMTGMPAFGSSHTTEKLWEMVAFLRQLPKLTAEQYEEMAKEISEAKRSP